MSAAVQTNVKSARACNVCARGSVADEREQGSHCLLCPADSHSMQCIQIRQDASV